MLPATTKSDINPSLHRNYQHQQRTTHYGILFQVSSPESEVAINGKRRKKWSDTTKELDLATSCFPKNLYMLILPSQLLVYQTNRYTPDKVYLFIFGVNQMQCLSLSSHSPSLLEK